MLPGSQASDHRVLVRGRLTLSFRRNEPFVETLLQLLLPELASEFSRCKVTVPIMSREAHVTIHSTFQPEPFLFSFDLLSDRTEHGVRGTKQKGFSELTRRDAMEWGIVIAAVGLVGMVGLMLEEVDVETEFGALGLPDYEPEYESLTINVADY